MLESATDCHKATQDAYCPACVDLTDEGSHTLGKNGLRRLSVSLGREAGDKGESLYTLSTFVRE